MRGNGARIECVAGGQPGLGVGGKGGVAGGGGLGWVGRKREKQKQQERNRSIAGGINPIPEQHRETALTGQNAGNC